MEQKINCLECIIPSFLVHQIRDYLNKEIDKNVVEGLYYGTYNALQIAIWGVSLQLNVSVEEMEGLLPGGIKVLGLFLILPHCNSDEILDFAENARASKQNSFNSVLIYNVQLGRLYLFNVQTDDQDRNMIEVDLNVIDAEHAFNFHQYLGITALHGSFDLSMRENDLSDKYTLEKWMEEIKEPHRIYLMFPDETNSSSYNHIIPLGETTDTCSTSKSLKSYLKTEIVGSKTKNMAKKNSSKDTSYMYSNVLKTLDMGNIPCFEFLFSMSPNGNVVTPTVSTTKADCIQSRTYHLDILLFMPIDESMTSVQSAIQYQLCRQIMFLSSNKTDAPTIYHVPMKGSAFPVCTSNGVDIHILKEMFLQLPDEGMYKYILPYTSLSYQATLLDTLSNTDDDEILVNVHEKLPKNSHVNGGKKYLVSGWYGYYHYMQQGIEDKGWGCAYRSLQTIASWYYLNLYTTKSVITHLEMQETLVLIEDKALNFIGSKQWIGTVEVGLILNQVYQINVKMIHIRSGSDIIQHVNELKEHFNAQGTPVMIGGGQLALTLLGMEYNDQTQDIALLILDPHYIGPDDLRTIQTKTVQLEGYKAIPCSWRKVSQVFFKKHFYNLCLPQRSLM